MTRSGVMGYHGDVVFRDEVEADLWRRAVVAAPPGAVPEIHADKIIEAYRKRLGGNSNAKAD